MRCNNKSKYVVGLFFYILSIQFLIGQTDFNDYKTLKSKGQIPSDFTKSTELKIQEDVESSKMSKSKSKKFYQKIHIGIDEILNSGLVVYGDEVTTYVSEIAKKLLQNETGVFEKLRFYTLKSNECNAFSTEQGIIFVTTGLIAQLENEAQLACVLSHEIAHYTEKHVVETFDYTNENKNIDIKNFSVYSKDKEYDADKISLKWYNEAGYSKEELLSTFDILLYSYLPFDEIEMPKNYFNTENIIFPDKYINYEFEPITAIEDYDDSESSHPNIKNRKIKLENEISKIDNWGNTISFFDENQFNIIRNICRFEYVRLAMIHHEFEKVIYSIFLLEKEFPNSIYLKKMKAQVWYNLLIKETESEYNVESDVNKEGEIGFVYHFVKSLKLNDLNTMALKVIYDSKIKFPNNITFSRLYDDLVTILKKNDKFILSDYSKMSLCEAYKEFDLHKNKTEEKDTTSSQIISKYDKIKKNKSEVKYTKDFDSTTFYLYGIPELISDSLFVFDLKKRLLISDSLQLNKANEQVNTMFEKYNLKKVIVLEPYVYSYFKDRFNLSKSEEISANYSKVIQETSNEFNVANDFLNFNSISTTGTNIFNDRSLIYNFLNQSIKKEFIYFSVDYEEILDATKRFETSNMIFTYGSHTVKQFMFIKRHKMKFNYYLLDINQSEVLEKRESIFHGKPVTYNLGAHFYDFLLLNNVKTN